MGQALPFVKPQTKFENFPILWYALLHWFRNVHLTTSPQLPRIEFKNNLSKVRVQMWLTHMQLYFCRGK